MTRPDSRPDANTGVQHAARTGHKSFCVWRLIVLIVDETSPSNSWRRRIFLFVPGEGPQRSEAETDCDRCCLVQVSFVTSEDRSDKGQFDGRLPALPVGSGDGRDSTGCSISPSCTSHFCSCPPTHPPVQSLRHGSIASPEREAAAKEDSHQLETQRPVLPDA